MTAPGTYVQLEQPCASLGLLKCFFQQVTEPLQNFDTGIVLVICRHEFPGRYVRARIFDHVVSRLFVRIPFAAVTPVLRRQLPALVRFLLAIPEPRPLLVRRDV